MSAVRTQAHEKYPTDKTVVSAADDVQTLLSTLEDADCRTILEVTDDDSLSASEISEACDVPLSTTYRKLGILTDVGLLQEATRLRRSGKHTSEYFTRVDDVVISVDSDDGLTVTISYCNPSNQHPNSLLASGW